MDVKGKEICHKWSKETALSGSFFFRSIAAAFFNKKCLLPQLFNCFIQLRIKITFKLK